MIFITNIFKIFSVIFSDTKISFSNFKAKVSEKIATKQMRVDFCYCRVSHLKWYNKQRFLRKFSTKLRYLLEEVDCRKQFTPLFRTLPTTLIIWQEIIRVISESRKLSEVSIECDSVEALLNFKISYRSGEISDLT